MSTLMTASRPRPEIRRALAPARIRTWARTQTGPGRLGVLAWVCAGLLAGGGGRPAAASPLEDSTLGGAVFTGPVHAHATAIYLNPAALGLADRGAHLYFDGSLRLDTYGIDRRVLSDPRDADSALVGGPRVEASTLAPGGTLAWYSVGESIAVGAAVSWVVLDQFIEEEEALGYHTLGGAHRQYVSPRLSVIGEYELPFDVPLPMPSLAGAYKWRNFYFGVGVSLRSTEFELSFLRDTALERGQSGIDAPCSQEPDAAPCGIENPAAAERYDVKVRTEDLFTTRNLVLNGGIMWQVAPTWWLGVYYQSPPGFLSSLRLQGKAQITPPAYQERDSFEAKAELIYRLPQTISAGLRGPIFADYDFFAAVRWQNLSRQRLLDFRLIDPTIGGGNVPEWITRYRGFDDNLSVSAGIEQREGGRLRLGGRLMAESETTSARAVSPLQVEGFQVTAAVGAELRLLDRLVLYGSYGLTYYPTVTAGADSLFDPQAQIDCVASDYNLDVCTPSAEGRAIPTAAGTYERMRHGFRAALRYDF
jgi:hypothetical protein